MNRDLIAKEVEWSFIRSSGPGGQNVNKVSSCAQLRWNLFSTEGVSEPQRLRLIQKLKTQLTKEGDILLRADEFRDRERNKSSALERLIQILQQGLHVAKIRKKTKPTKSSQKKRVDSKVKRGEIKKGRSQKIIF